MNLKCLLGFHKWNSKDGFYFDANIRFKRRTCKICRKVQEEAYDMYHGEKYWTNVK